MRTECHWAPQSDRQRGLSARGRDQVPSRLAVSGSDRCGFAVALLGASGESPVSTCRLGGSSRQVRERGALDRLHFLKATRYLKNPSNAQKAAEALVEGFLPDKAADAKVKLSSPHSVRAFSCWSTNIGRLLLDLMDRRQWESFFPADEWRCLHASADVSPSSSRHVFGCLSNCWSGDPLDEYLLTGVNFVSGSAKLERILLNIRSLWRDFGGESGTLSIRNFLPQWADALGLEIRGLHCVSSICSH